MSLVLGVNSNITGKLSILWIKSQGPLVLSLYYALHARDINHLYLDV